MMKILFIFTFFSIIALADTVKIASNPPEAEIWVHSDPNEQPEKIGKTPYKSNLKDLINTYVKKSTFIVEVKKKGFEDYRILFTKMSGIDVDLSVNLAVEDKVKTIKDHDLLMISLFDVQKLIRSGNFSDAIYQLNELEKTHKGFSIIAELKATTYYMNKDIENALAYYRSAFALNPDNVDAYKMKVYLEKKLGVDSEL